MADPRDRFENTAGKAKGMAERVGDQAKSAGQAVSERVKDTTSGVVGAVKEKAQDVAAGASELAAKAKDRAQDWASNVGDTARQAKDQAQELASAAYERVGDWGEDVTVLIRRYPLQALLVGVGVGFLLGQALRSSSRSY